MFSVLVKSKTFLADYNIRFICLNLSCQVHKDLVELLNDGRIKISKTKLNSLLVYLTSANLKWRSTNNSYSALCAESAKSYIKKKMSHCKALKTCSNNRCYSVSQGRPRFQISSCSNLQSMRTDVEFNKLPLLQQMWSCDTIRQQEEHLLRSNKNFLQLSFTLKRRPIFHNKSIRSSSMSFFNCYCNCKIWRAAINHMKFNQSIHQSTNQW